MCISRGVFLRINAGIQRNTFFNMVAHDILRSGEISSIKKALIIEKLGPSLHELMLKKPEKRFQMNEIALIGERITTIL